MATDEELAAAGMVTVAESSMQSLVREIQGLRSDVHQMREEINGLKAQVAKSTPAAVLPRADEPPGLPPPPPPPPVHAPPPPPVKKGKSSFAVRDPFFAAALKRAHPMFVAARSTPSSRRPSSTSGRTKNSGLPGCSSNGRRGWAPCCFARTRGCEPRTPTAPPATSLRCSPACCARS